jgi:hypothetical protein
MGGQIIRKISVKAEVKYSVIIQFFGNGILYENTKVGEQRNHSLKYESYCVGIGIGVKMFMNRGRFCKRSFR